MQALTQTLSVLAIAIVVSMLVSLIIKTIVTLLGRQSAQPAPAAPSAAGTYGTGGTSTAGTSGADSQSLPPHHVAAIAAALSTVLDEPQIVHIEPSRQGAGWTAESRTAHRGSHNTGRSPRRPTR